MQVDLDSPEFRRLLEEMLAEAVARYVAENERKARELSIMDRLVRVEEEIKALRELMYEYMKLSDKRLEAMERANQQRFEAMEKRFEALQREMNARFEALQREMDARFEAVEKRFEAMERANQQRFEAMEKRFEAMEKEMNSHFEALEKRFNFMQWFMGVGFGFLAFLITLLNFLAH